MIVSITEERVWSSLLTQFPQWSPPRAPMLVIAPHPDDEILGVGGLIAAQRNRSQLVREPGEPILPPSLLGPAQRRFEVFLVP